MECLDKVDVERVAERGWHSRVSISIAVELDISIVNTQVFICANVVDANQLLFNGLMKLAVFPLRWMYTISRT